MSDTPVEVEAAVSFDPRPFHAVLLVEDVWTGDGRLIEAGATSWRDLPLPLMWLKEDSHGGMPGASVPVGRIDRIERDGLVVHGWGVLDFGTPDAPNDDARRVEQMLRAGVLRGVSVDMDDMEVEVEVPEGDDDDGMLMEDVKVRATSARVMGATVVAFPAFPEAMIELGVGDEGSPPATPAPNPADDEMPMALPVPAAAATRPTYAEWAADPSAAVEAILRAAFADVPPGAPPAVPDEPEADDEDEPEPSTGTPSGAAIALLAEGDETVEGSTDVQPLHLTLTYLGDAAALTDTDRQAVLDTAARVAASLPGPIDAAVSGRGYLGADDATVAFVEDPAIEDARAEALADPTVARLAMTAQTHPHFVPHVTVAYGASVDEFAWGDTYRFDRVAVMLAGEVTEYPLGAEALVASAVPVHPPAVWFTRPEFAEATPLTVGDDGRVFGHLATWGECHIGLAGCVTAPSSPSSYARFLLGEVVTAEGARVPVGRITLGTGHAPLSSDPRAAAAHYDNTGTAVADVTCGEDEFGVWVAGALRPGVTAAQVRTLRSSPLSGDWRAFGGRLDLVGVLAVNVPGFPVPRVRVASGAPLALVAAGTLNPTARARSKAAHPSSRMVATLIAQAVGRDPESRRRHLYAVVHKEG